MSDQIDHQRRRFFGAVALTAAATQFAFKASAHAQTLAQNGPAKTGSNASFPALKQINAGLLNVGYAEAGPADGKPVLLLHGWPYDIHSFVSMSRRGSPRPVIASSFRTCEAMERQRFYPIRRFATASPRPSPRM
jgi:hypothetical protein